MKQSNIAAIGNAPDSTTGSTEDSAGLLFSLHPPQVDFLDFAIGNLTGRDILGACPTGFGKSLLGVFLLDRFVGPDLPFSHAIVAVPMDVIGGSFLSPHPRTCRYRGQAVTISPDFIRMAGAEGGSTTRDVLDYLSLPQPDHALVCSHAALQRALVAEDAPADLSRALLWFDEAHHAPSEENRKAVDRWKQGGGRLAFATATPYRSDSLRVVRDDMEVFSREVADHMADGYAPRHLVPGLIPIGNPGQEVETEVLYGIRVAKDEAILDDLVAKLVGDWRAMGFPKAIFHIPGMDGGIRKLVDRLIAALGAAYNGPGVILNAYGEGDDLKRGVVDALQAERSVDWRRSEIAAIVGCQRIREGMDWVHASTMYCVGIPRSISYLVQLIGRILRWKPEDYPAPHRDHSHVRFFVPYSGRSQAERHDEFLAHALLICSFFHNFERAGELVAHRVVARAKGVPPETFPLGPVAQTALGVERVMRIHVAADAELARRGGDVRLGDLVEAVARQVPGVDREQVAEVVALRLIKKAAEVRGSFGQIAANLARTNPAASLAESKREAIAALVREFAERTVAPEFASGWIAEVVHLLDGGTIREYGERALGFEYVSDEYACAMALAMWEANPGRKPNRGWPTAFTDKAITGTAVSWKAYHSRLSARPDPQNPDVSDSLSKLLDRFFPSQRYSFEEVSEDYICLKAFEHWESVPDRTPFRGWPSPLGSDFLPGTSVSWQAINARLAQRPDPHCPSTNDSLTKLLDRKFPKHRDWDDDAMAKEAKAIFEATSKPPEKNGIFVAYAAHKFSQGITWSDLKESWGFRAKRSRNLAFDAERIDRAIVVELLSGKSPTSILRSYLCGFSMTAYSHHIKQKTGDSFGEFCSKLPGSPYSAPSRKERLKRDEHLLIDYRDAAIQFREVNLRWPRGTSGHDLPPYPRWANVTDWLARREILWDDFIAHCDAARLAKIDGTPDPPPLPMKAAVRGRKKK